MSAPPDPDALAALAAAATDGPWRVVLDDSESATTVWQVCTSPEHPAGEPDIVHDCCADGGLHGSPWYREADALLIAALRNAAPELIRRAREAGDIAKALADAYTAVDTLRPDPDHPRGYIDADGHRAVNGNTVEALRQRDAARAEVARARKSVTALAQRAHTAEQRANALQPVADAARELLSTDSEGGESVAYDWAHKQLAAAVDALDADVPVPLEPDIVERQYLIWSHHHKAWWGPDGSGYREHIADAGRYALADTTQWLRRGCGCCPVPEVVIPAPPVALVDPTGSTKRRIKRATAERIAAGQVNRYATDGGAR